MNAVRAKYNFRRLPSSVLFDILGHVVYSRSNESQLGFLMMKQILTIFVNEC